MDIHLAKAIVEGLNDEGKEATLHEAYSGRGMNGRSTAGISCDNVTDILVLVLKSPELFIEEDDDWGVTSRFLEPDDLRLDSLGLGVIVY